MFTQQHYIAVAEIIKGARVGARKVYDSRDGDLAFSEYDARMDQIAAVQLAFIRKFENDNPKFNKLLFIGACGESGMSQEV